MNRVWGEVPAFTAFYDQVRQELATSTLPHDYVVQQRIRAAYSDMLDAFDAGDQVQAGKHKLALIVLKQIQSGMPYREWVNL